jgi:hypothetical protein
MALTKVSNSMITGAMINALDYGAVGNGVTNDTAAIKAARDAAVGNGQSTLYLPTGLYLVDEQIDVSQCGVMGDGVYASRILAAPSFTDESILYVGSLSQNLVYQNFRINGNRTNVSATVAGLIIEGNVLHDQFSSISIIECTGDGIIIRNGNGGTTRPSVNTFIDLRIIENDGRGLYYTSGRVNTFITCNFEQLGEEGIVCDGSVDPTDPPQTTTFQEVWVEQVGLNHLTSGGVNAVTLNTAYGIHFINADINGYGSNPATTGYGIEFLDCTVCSIESPGIGFNRSGASTATSAPIRIQGGTRQRLIQLPSNINSTNISVTSGDYIVKSAISTSANSGTQIFVANATTIAGGTTNFVQQSTGLVLASNAAARFIVASRFTLQRIYAEATTLPGPVGLLYSVTVQKNGVDTALVTNLSDANGASGSTVAEVSFEVGDAISLKVVTSAGAVTIVAGGLHIALAYMER